MTMRLALLLLVACSSGPSEPVTALDHVELCAPGRSYAPCSNALSVARTKGGVFPAGDLVDIELVVPHLADGALTLAASTQISYRHLMYFRDGYGTVRTRVMSLLQKELGPPTNKGVAPIGDPGVFVGDFWLVDDGIWICSEQAVLWYSKPFHDDGDATWVKRIARAPTSAPLWNKLGRLLVTH